jgi:methyl-accepting chemotaxis protein
MWARAFGGSQSELQAKVTAMMRSQAVIEFDLDGAILWANDNFLRAMGYDLAEIVGKHHSMFCDPAYVQGPDYRQFWQDLRQGQFRAEVYRRIAVSPRAGGKCGSRPATTPCSTPKASRSRS